MPAYSAVSFIEIEMVLGNPFMTRQCVALQAYSASTEYNGGIVVFPREQRNIVELYTV